MAGVACPGVAPRRGVLLDRYLAAGQPPFTSHNLPAQGRSISVSFGHDGTYRPIALPNR